MTETETHSPKPHDANLPNTPASEAAYAAGQEAAHNKWLLLIIGIVTLIGGMIAIAMPLLASFTAALVAAWVLIASGLVGIVAALRRHHGWHMLSAALGAALSVLIGVLILLQPMIGLLTLTALIIAFFAASGALRLYYGARLLRDGSGGGWMIAGGALSVILAIILLTGLPFSAAWVPGVLLGVDLMIWGIILIAVGTTSARLAAAREMSAGAA